MPKRKPKKAQPNSEVCKDDDMMAEATAKEFLAISDTDNKVKAKDTVIRVMPSKLPQNNGTIKNALSKESSSDAETSEDEEIEALKGYDKNNAECEDGSDDEDDSDEVDDSDDDGDEDDSDEDDVDDDSGEDSDDVDDQEKNDGKTTVQKRKSETKSLDEPKVKRSKITEVECRVEADDDIGKSHILLVRNFGKGTDEAALKAAFTGCLSARVPIHMASGIKKGFGFVEYNTVEEAAEAKKSMFGQSICGREITIEYSKPVERRIREKPVALVVKNLDDDTCEQTLKDAFEGCFSARVPVSEKGRKKGFGIVKFLTREKAVEAMNTMSGQTIGGKQITVHLDEEGSKLFITNLSYTTDERTLQDAFVGCDSVSIPCSDTGRRKGFAFVTYRTTEEAIKAKELMSDQLVDGRPIRIGFSYSKSREPNFRARAGTIGWPFIRCGRGGR